MNRNTSLAGTLFAVLVWTVLLILIADRAYDKLINPNAPDTFGTTLKHMEDLSNGNP